jgi:hypothetical protein
MPALRRRRSADRLARRVARILIQHRPQMENREQRSRRDGEKYHGYSSRGISKRRFGPIARPQLQEGEGEQNACGKAAAMRGIINCDATARGNNRKQGWNDGLRRPHLQPRSSASKGQAEAHHEESAEQTHNAARGADADNTGGVKQQRRRRAAECAEREKCARQRQPTNLSSAVPADHSTIPLKRICVTPACRSGPVKRRHHSPCCHTREPNIPPI